MPFMWVHVSHVIHMRPWGVTHVQLSYLRMALHAATVNEWSSLALYMTIHIATVNEWSSRGSLSVL